jgi:hypothetical protein
MFSPRRPGLSCPLLNVVLTANQARRPTGPGDKSAAGRADGPGTNEPIRSDPELLWTALPTHLR